MTLLATLPFSELVLVHEARVRLNRSECFFAALSHNVLRSHNPSDCRDKLGDVHSVLKERGAFERLGVGLSRGAVAGCLLSSYSGSSNLPGGEHFVYAVAHEPPQFGRDSAILTLRDFLEGASEILGDANGDVNGDQRLLSLTAHGGASFGWLRGDHRNRVGHRPTASAQHWLKYNEDQGDLVDRAALLAPPEFA